MHPTVQEIARTLRTARASQGLTQRELAERIGLTQAQISRFEGGHVDLRLSSLVELARGAGVEVMLIPRKAVPAALALGVAATDRDLSGG